MKKKILVFYVGVMGMDYEDVPEYIQKVSKKITPIGDEFQSIFIPLTSTFDTRVECINPEYIAEQELIEKNKKLLDELNESLKTQTEILKKEKNER